MIPRLSLTALWLLLLAAPAAFGVGPGSGPEPLRLTGLGRATLPLDGPWKFETGDDLAWAAAGL